MHTGLYINLDRSLDRRNALLASMEAAGIAPHSYFRLAAIEPSAEELRAQRGLKSRGELGIWRSMLRAFEVIASGDFADIVHVIEDDTSFPSGSAEKIHALAEMMAREEGLQHFDVIFLDYFVTQDMFRQFAGVSKHEGGEVNHRSISLAPARHFYLACLSSFLVRRRSASYIGAALSRMLDPENGAPPIDMAVRALVNLGAIKAAVVTPPITAPSWEQDGNTTIQTERDDAVRLAQRADLTLRLVAAGLDSPFAGAARLADLFNVTNTLAPDADALAFADFFQETVGRRAAY